MQPELVRDGVDARVVRVHQRRAALGEHAAVLDEHRGGAPAVERHVAQVRGGEPRRAELAAGHHRYRPAEERGVALHAERVGRPALVDGPAQDVEHRAVDAGSGTRARRAGSATRPVVIEVSADAVVDGRDGGDRRRR